MPHPRAQPEDMNRQRTYPVTKPPATQDVHLPVAGANVLVDPVTEKAGNLWSSPLWGLPEDGTVTSITIHTSRQIRISTAAFIKVWSSTSSQLLQTQSLPLIPAPGTLVQQRHLLYI